MGKEAAKKKLRDFERKIAEEEKGPGFSAISWCMASRARIRGENKLDEGRSRPVDVRITVRLIRSYYLSRIQVRDSTANDPSPPSMSIRMMYRSGRARELIEYSLAFAVFAFVLKGFPLLIFGLHVRAIESRFSLLRRVYILSARLSDH